MNKTYRDTGGMEKKKYRITPVSPVHIRGGDGSGDYGQGYIIDPKDKGFIYLVDTLKLQKYLFDNHGKFDAVSRFNHWLESDRSKKQGITAFLETEKFDFGNVNKVSKGKVHVQKTINSFIRNGMNRAYIPGSSVKGVIRTAVLWKILQGLRQNDPGFDTKLLHFLGKRIQQFNENGRQNTFKQNFAQDITTDIFQNLLLKSSRMHMKHKVESPSPFSDLFKAVKVKDSNVIGKRFIQTRQWGLLSLQKNQPYLKSVGRQNKLQVFCADRQQQGDVCFDILIDHELLDSFDRIKIHGSWGDYAIPFQDIDGLMDIVFDFSQSIWSMLSDFYALYCKPATSGTVSAKPNQIIGKVKMIKVGDNGEKRFGFITIPDCSGDAFFHISDVEDRDQALIKEGDVVVVENVENTSRGLNARSVSVDNTKKMLVPPLDINALGNFYQNNCLEKIMKIGWGTGLLGTTIALFLKDNDKLTLRRDGVPVHVLEILRNEVIHQVPVKKGKFVPKSSRVILNSEQKPEYPLGWVKLEEIR